MKDNKMKLLLYEYRDNLYPTYLKGGKAASFIIPFAKEFCFGSGLDIGGLFNCDFPGAQIINILNNDKWNAENLPNKRYDYIFSSHTLEHLNNYIKILEYWKKHLKEDGVLFLYLPHPDMEYWLPQNNRKHIHRFEPKEIQKLLIDLGFSSVIISERDLYWSFAVIGFN